MQRARDEAIGFAGHPPASKTPRARPRNHHARSCCLRIPPDRGLRSPASLLERVVHTHWPACVPRDARGYRPPHTFAARDSFSTKLGGDLIPLDLFNQRA